MQITFPPPGELWLKHVQAVPDSATLWSSGHGIDTDGAAQQSFGRCFARLLVSIDHNLLCSACE